ncbi:MAG: hypothetical protein ACI9R3_000800 [Verrucomicrobiales bacterium]|jgi:hypothetical protein
MKAAIIAYNVIGMCLFALFGYFQLNDNSDTAIYENPSSIDVILWALFYAYIAFLHGIGIFKPVPIVLLVLGVLACLLELTFAAPGMCTNLTGGHFTLAGDGMQASIPEVERSREFLGACIALAGVIIVAGQRRWWNRSE